MKREKLIIILLAVCSFTERVSAQTKKLDNILYGAAYYQEYMPEDRLEEDLKLMKASGMSVVRLGESSWSLFEPREGEFDFAWMDRIIDGLHKNGIKVILGTPTYSIPAWLWHKHPEVLLKYEKGANAYYGIRQNMDITNPAFLFYAERVIGKMMEHYTKNPAIIGFQVDNETTSYNANNYDFQISFVDYLKKKFGTVERLNKIWGLNYWGMTMNGWEEFPERDGVTNTGYKLEWERFKRKAVADYLNWQTEIVRAYKRPDQFVTHCFMPAVQDIDQVESAKNMDVLAVNVYHGSQDKLTGEEIAFAGDYFRSVKRKNYLITETNAQTTGWDSKSQAPPYDGQLRMNVYAHMGSGANMVEYWHWHSIHYGQETYWKGILSHDLQPNRAYAEYSKTAHELQRFGSKLVNLKIKNDVAILFSHDANTGLNVMPFKDPKVSIPGKPANIYRNELVAQFHKVLFRNSVGTDFIFPESTNFGDYKLIIIPSLYIASDTLLDKINNYIAGGGHVIMQFKSGFCDENSMVRPMLAPGPLRKACGFYYQEFTNFKALSLKDNPFRVDTAGNKVYDWGEYLIPETAKPLAFYDHPYFGKYPAVTINTFGKGTLLYEATNVSDAIQEKLILQEMDRAGIKTIDQKMHWPLVTKSGNNDAGKKVHYYYNYSSQRLNVTYPYTAGIELVTGKVIMQEAVVEIEPWDVLIIEEK
ncbi:beta-galactosidase [Mucilaginibacter sp. Mucisp86]|uniref:beta-galactosidase n=1 Tax=Mucilaginibacter sp. Mucisp86 TaxID=3243060 RepID=UPI0039B36678